MRKKGLNITPEIAAFIELNQTVARAMLASRVNDKFGRSYTTEQIKGYCARMGFKAEKSGRFQKGHIPHPNAKPKGPNSTSFKKGRSPHNTKPIGYERINRDGYIDIKTSYSYPQFRLKSHVIYEQHHRVNLTSNDIIRFKDGNKLNLNIDNLERFTKAENARLNQLNVNGMPEQLRPAAKSVCRLKQKIADINGAELCHS